MSDPFDLEALLRGLNDRMLEDCWARDQKLQEALKEALAAFQDDQRKGILAALDAVIDFLPIALAEPLRVLEERLDDARPCGNRKGRGHRKKRSQATFEAKVAAVVDGLVKHGVEPTIDAACRRVSAEFKDRLDWRRLRTLRNHLRKGNGRPEAIDAYRYWRDVYCHPERQRPW